MVNGVVYIVCFCGQKHRLIPGTVKPVYWCGDELKELQEGDTVEIKDRESRGVRNG